MLISSAIPKPKAPEVLWLRWAPPHFTTRSRTGEQQCFSACDSLMYTLLLTFCFQDWKRNIDQKRRWAITSCFSTVTVLYCAIDGHSGAFYIKGKIRSLPQETYSLAVGTLEVTVRGQEPIYVSKPKTELG